MEVIYTSPNGIESPNPDVHYILKSLSVVKGWGIGELKCLKNDQFYSQLLLIIESDIGVLLRFCPEDGADEYVYADSKQKSIDCKNVTTFDGGDEWIVPESFFISIDSSFSIIDFYLKTGDRILSEKWHMLGT